MAKKEKATPQTIEHRIALLSKTKGTQTRMMLSEYSNRTSVDIRQWYKKADMEKFAPTRKGISLAVEDLPALLKATKKAIRVAKREGLLPDDE